MGLDTILLGVETLNPIDVDLNEFPGIHVSDVHPLVSDSFADEDLVVGPPVGGIEPSVGRSIPKSAYRPDAATAVVAESPTNSIGSGLVLVPPWLLLIFGMHPKRNGSWISLINSETGGESIRCDPCILWKVKRTSELGLNGIETGQSASMSGESP